MGKTFYKSFDSKLCGHGGYRFEVGKEYDAETEDTFRWFHYAPKVSTAASFGDKGMRICEVRPTGKTQHFGATYGHGPYQTADRILVVRELTEEEIFEHLLKERCRFFIMEKLKPQAEVLKRAMPYFKGEDRRLIAHCDYLTLAEKKELLPKHYHREAERYSF